jgi:hypothetical protein
MAPVSWRKTWRSRRLHAFINAAASHSVAMVVNLFGECANDPFVQRPELPRTVCIPTTQAIGCCSTN